MKEYKTPTSNVTDMKNHETKGRLRTLEEVISLVCRHVNVSAPIIHSGTQKNKGKKHMHMHAVAIFGTDQT